MASKPKRRWGKKKTAESGESTPVNATNTSGYPTKEPLRDRTNQAAAFALKLVRSELQMCDAQLANDFTSIVSGGSIYIPEFVCAEHDDSLFRSLLDDLTAYAEKMQETNASQSESAASDIDGDENQLEIGNGDTIIDRSADDKNRNPAVDVKGGPSAGLVKWSKHLKHEDPDFSPTFMKIIQQIGDYFDMDIFAKRLNYYRDGKDWKPFHHDSHAYAKGKGQEDFTVGASFGSERQLEFLHEPSGAIMAFPQRNGDVFAFDTAVNQKFKHGVPKAARGGPRISIICWGRRRTLNPRNSSVKK